MITSERKVCFDCSALSKGNVVNDFYSALVHQNLKCTINGASKQTKFKKNQKLAVDCGKSFLKSSLGCLLNKFLLENGIEIREYWEH